MNRKIEQIREYSIIKDGKEDYLASDIVYKVPVQENYIKIFIDGILNQNCKLDIQIKMFIAIISNATYCDKDHLHMIVELNGRWQKVIGEKIGLSDRNVRRWIRIFIDQGLLIPTEQRSVYIVNPFIAGKGEWKDIVKSREILEGSLKI